MFRIDKTAQEKMKELKKLDKDSNITTLTGKDLDQINIIELRRQCSILLQRFQQDQKVTWDRLAEIENKIKLILSQIQPNIDGMNDRIKSLEDLLCGFTDIDNRIVRANEAIKSIEKQIMYIGDLFHQMSDKIKNGT
jgi:hypothetical protein